MTGTDVARFTHKSVPVIFEPPCTYTTKMARSGAVELLRYMSGGGFDSWWCHWNFSST